MHDTPDANGDVAGSGGAVLDVDFAAQLSKLVQSLQQPLAQADADVSAAHVGHADDEATPLAAPKTASGVAMAGADAADTVDTSDVSLPEAQQAQGSVLPAPRAESDHDADAAPALRPEASLSSMLANLSSLFGGASNAAAAAKDASSDATAAAAGVPDAADTLSQLTALHANLGASLLQLQKQMQTPAAAATASGPEAARKRSDAIRAALQKRRAAPAPAAPAPDLTLLSEEVATGFAPQPPALLPQATQPPAPRPPMGPPPPLAPAPEAQLPPPAPRLPDAQKDSGLDCAPAPPDAVEAEQADTLQNTAEVDTQAATAPAEATRKPRFNAVQARRAALQGMAKAAMAAVPASTLQAPAHDAIVHDPSNRFKRAKLVTDHPAEGPTGIEALPPAATLERHGKPAVKLKRKGATAEAKDRVDAAARAASKPRGHAATAAAPAATEGAGAATASARLDNFAAAQLRPPGIAVPQASQRGRDEGGDVAAACSSARQPAPAARSQAVCAAPAPANPGKAGRAAKAASADISRSNKGASRLKPPHHDATTAASDTLLHHAQAASGTQGPAASGTPSSTYSRAADALPSKRQRIANSRKQITAELARGAAPATAAAAVPAAPPTEARGARSAPASLAAKLHASARPPVPRRAAGEGPAPSAAHSASPATMLQAACKCKGAKAPKVAASVRESHCRPLRRARSSHAAVALRREVAARAASTARLVQGLARCNQPRITHSQDRLLRFRKAAAPQAPSSRPEASLRAAAATRAPVATSQPSPASHVQAEETRAQQHAARAADELAALDVVATAPGRARVSPPGAATTAAEQQPLRPPQPQLPFSPPHASSADRSTTGPALSAPPLRSVAVGLPIAKREVQGTAQRDESDDEVALEPQRAATSPAPPAKASAHSRPSSRAAPATCALLPAGKSARPIATPHDVAADALPASGVDSRPALSAEQCSQALRDSSAVADDIRLRLSRWLPNANVALATAPRIRRKLELQLARDLEPFNALITALVQQCFADRAAFDAGTAAATLRQAERIEAATAARKEPAQAATAHKQAGVASLAAKRAAASAAGGGNHTCARRVNSTGKAGAAAGATPSIAQAASAGSKAASAAMGGIFLPQKRSAKDRVRAELTPAQLQHHARRAIGSVSSAEQKR